MGFSLCILDDVLNCDVDGLAFVSVSNFSNSPLLLPIECLCATPTRQCLVMNSTGAPQAVSNGRNRTYHAEWFLLIRNTYSMLITFLSSAESCVEPWLLMPPVLKYSFLRRLKMLMPPVLKHAILPLPQRTLFFTPMMIFFLFCSTPDLRVLRPLSVFPVPYFTPGVHLWLYAARNASQNPLSGTIPPELGSLTLLSVL